MLNINHNKHNEMYSESNMVVVSLQSILSRKLTNFNFNQQHFRLYHFSITCHIKTYKQDLNSSPETNSQT